MYSVGQVCSVGDKGLAAGVSGGVYVVRGSV